MSPLAKSSQLGDRRIIRTRTLVLFTGAALTIGTAIRLLVTEMVRSSERENHELVESVDLNERLERATAEPDSFEPGIAASVVSIVAAPTRSVIEADPRIALPPHVAERLLRNGETVADYERYVAQEFETRRIVSELSVHWFFMLLRPSRFDGERFVSERLAKTRPLSEKERRSASALLVPLCDALIMERRLIWKQKQLDRGSSRGFLRLAKRNLSEREAWILLESRFAERIDVVDRELRRLLGLRAGVIAK